MKEREYRIKLTEENKSKVEQFLKLLNVDVDIVEAENTLEEEKEWIQDGDTYYYIYSDGDILNDIFNSNYSFCKSRLAIGNCFKTREEAEFEVERLKVIAEMKKFAESKDRKWDSCNKHWMIYFDVNRNVNYGYNCMPRYDCIYFESEKKARECVKAVGEDRIKKNYLQIKE